MQDKNGSNKISRNQYERVIEKCKNDELIIMIDTASFRQLFCDKKAMNELDNIIEYPIYSQTVLIRLIFYSLPLSAVVMSFFSILAFEIWAILILPILLIISILIHSKASLGIQKINGAIIFLIVCVISAFFLSKYGIYFQIAIILFPIQIFLSKFLYYHTSKIVFKLLFTNYRFFALFYEVKYTERSMIPMVFIESNEDYNDFLEFKKKNNLDFKHYQELLNVRNWKEAWKVNKD